jgi:hypothetical protein
MPRHAQEKATVKRSIPIMAIRENVPVMALAGIAFGASYGHIVKLCHDHGQHGWVQFATAGVVDLLCVIGAEERQRDKRISRPRAGKWPSWSAVVLVVGIVLTLAANIATAEPGLLGYFVAALPAGALLLAVSVLERRASFEAPASTKASRRQSRPASTEAVPSAPAPVLGSGTVPALQGSGEEDPPPAERTFGTLLGEARAYRDELAAAGNGERATKERLRLRLGVSSGTALKLAQALRDEAREAAEAVV